MEIKLKDFEEFVKEHNTAIRSMFIKYSITK